MRVLAGAAAVDITPPEGLAMAGFGARDRPAQGWHDRLGARALVIGGTGLVALDVLGVEAGMAARIRARARLPDAAIVVAATHTHGGPVSMSTRLTVAPDPAWLARMEDAAVAALDNALADARPAVLAQGVGQDPGIAQNRRHPDGPVDRALPLLTVRAEAGDWIAVLASAALHPVVLGADNLLWTADYPHVLRARLEAAFPGALAVFVTGCTGDVNSGHSAQASLSTDPTPRRSFAEAGRIGTTLAEAMLAAPRAPVPEGPVRAREAVLQLPLHRSGAEADPAALAAAWRTERPGAGPVRALLLDHWIRWAETAACAPADPVPARVSLLDWGGARLLALPGEIFAETGLGLRRALGPADFAICYAEDNPGYIPPAGEYAHGGYEVAEAHRYYGMPAAFAPGAAEALAAAATALAAADR